MKYKLAVIGSPIKHTLSPLIHKTFLEYMKIDYEYSVVDVKKGKVSEYIDYAKENSVSGFNVTMPHKQDIIKYLDDIDREAAIYNSVNTVKNESGRLIGYNTDAEGYKMSLSECGASLKDAVITVIGAGGAANSIVLKAALEGAGSITVLNRDINKAKRLSENVAEKTKFIVDADFFTIDNARAACRNTDILINATPLGMSGFDGDFPDLSFVDELKKTAIVSDLIYNPPETKLLKYAKNYGIKTVNGLGMLIYQGLIADKIYFCRNFDFKSVKNLIEEKYYVKK